MYKNSIFNRTNYILILPTITQAIQLVALSKSQALKKKEVNKFFNLFTHLLNNIDQAIINKNLFFKINQIYDSNDVL